MPTTTTRKKLNTLVQAINLQRHAAGRPGVCLVESPPYQPYRLMTESAPGAEPRPLTDWMGAQEATRWLAGFLAACLDDTCKTHVAERIAPRQPGQSSST